MWFSLERGDLGYLDRSPHRMQFEKTLPASPARVFDVVANGEEMGTWFDDFVACRWTSPLPHGLGSTREIELKMLTVKERFVAWTPGERIAFCMDAITLPLVTAMAEDIRFEASGPSATRMRWNVHYTLPLWMRPFHPIARAVFGKMFRKSMENLSRRVVEA